MKVKVNEENCIGCGYCEGICDEVFSLEDGVSHVIVDEVPVEYEDNVRDALEGCPTSAIEEIEE